MARGTGTGAVLEAMILPALDRGGYSYRTQARIGDRLGCGAHYVDLVASKAESSFLVSLKWQQVSGTAEQKVPFEVICLMDAVRRTDHRKAYLVLGGDGWSLRQFYTSGGLRPFLDHTGVVEILSLEAFVALANTGKL